MDDMADYKRIGKVKVVTVVAVGLTVAVWLALGLFSAHRSGRGGDEQPCGEQSVTPATCPGCEPTIYAPRAVP